MFIDSNFFNLKTTHTMKDLEQKIKRHWPLIEHKIREEYPNMGDKDLTYQVGKEGALLEKIQEVTTKSDEDLRDFIMSCC